MYEASIRNSTSTRGATVINNKKKYSSGAKTKGYIKNKVTGKTKSFLFNPSELTFSREATYSETSSPGLSYPLTQYVRGNLLTFSLPLYIYDKPYSGLVSKWETFLNSFVPPTTNNSSYTKPNDLMVCMGSFIRECVVESLEVHYTDFNEALNPTEATFTLQLRQV